NELLPLLSAGVSTRRVVRPVLFSACAMLGLVVANQELIVPPIGNKLVNDRDDPNGEKDIVVRGAYEPNGIHVEGRIASRKGMVVRDPDPKNPGFFVVIPETIAGCLINLSAKEGRYIPPGDGPRAGGWLLTGTNPPELDQKLEPILEMIDPGKYFL